MYIVDNNVVWLFLKRWNMEKVWVKYAGPVGKSVQSPYPYVRLIDIQHNAWLIFDVMSRSTVKFLLMV